MKKWAVLTVDQVKSRNKGSIVYPEIVEANTRIEAKRIFVKKYSNWSISQLVASIVK
jgi:hypothetical protein